MKYLLACKSAFQLQMNHLTLNQQDVCTQLTIAIYHSSKDGVLPTTRTISSLTIGYKTLLESYLP